MTLEPLDVGYPLQIMEELRNISGCQMDLNHFNNTADFGALLNPTDGSEYWIERTDVWKAFFYLMLVVFAILFLALAGACILLLVKRHTVQRFKVNTFIAIDISLTILGLSRVVFIIVDPWGQSGFCDNVACRVVSRLSGALAFPSLTASYTLVFITLWMSARLQVGQSCYQRVNVLVPLCCIHYVVAIIFEIVGLIPWNNNSMVVMSLLIGCEAIFSLWGFLVCFAYLFAGYRLLHSIEKTVKESSRICRDSPNLNRHQLIEKSAFKNQKSRARANSNMKLKHMVKEHHRRAIRKVNIIMYIAVTLGMLYSIVTLLNLTLMSINLFDGCPGFIVGQEPNHPGVWLMFRYLFFTLELLLALLLLYSIADIRLVVIFLRGCLRMTRLSSDTKKQPQAIYALDTSGNTLDRSSTPSNTSPRTTHVKFILDEDKEKIEQEEKKQSRSMSPSPVPAFDPSVPSPLKNSTKMNSDIVEPTDSL